MNMLRMSLVLVLAGFFLPVACSLNGYQVAQGILGTAQKAGNAALLGPVEDVFGYVLLAVPACAVVGLFLSVVVKGKGSSLLTFTFLVLSFALLAVVGLKFNFIRNSALIHTLVEILSIKVRILVGGYVMGCGYAAGVIGFALRFSNVIS